MRTLAFDGRMGASGDMLLGALVDAGADPDALAPVEAALDVRYEIETVDERGIAATDVRVLLSADGAADSEGAGTAEEGDDEDAGHDHEDRHSHRHAHPSTSTTTNTNTVRGTLTRTITHTVTTGRRPRRGTGRIAPTRK